MIHCLFLNPAEPSDIRCCSVVPKMSPVVCHLPYFRQQPITHPLLALLPFQLFVYFPVFCRDQLLAPPSFSGVLSASCPLCCVLVFSSLFIIQFVLLFLFSRGSVCPGGYAGLSQGWLEEYHMMFGLPNISQAGLQPTFFLSVTWLGEVFYRLGVQAVKVLTLLDASPPPSMAPES
jgi:hypothetical protein